MTKLSEYIPMGEGHGRVDENNVPYSLVFKHVGRESEEAFKTLNGIKIRGNTITLKVTMDTSRNGFYWLDFKDAGGPVTNKDTLVKARRAAVRLLAVQGLIDDKMAGEITNVTKQIAEFDENAAAVQSPAPSRPQNTGWSLPGLHRPRSGGHRR